MTRNEIIATVTLGVLGGVIANEIGDYTSWLARKIVRRAARLWARNGEMAEAYEEEWQALVNERPGKLLKVLSALGFLGTGICMWGASNAKARIQQRPQAARKAMTWTNASPIAATIGGVSLGIATNLLYSVTAATLLVAASAGVAAIYSILPAGPSARLALRLLSKVRRLQRRQPN